MALLLLPLLALGGYSVADGLSSSADEAGDMLDTASDLLTRVLVAGIVFVVAWGMLLVALTRSGFFGEVGGLVRTVADALGLTAALSALSGVVKAVL